MQLDGFSSLSTEFVLLWYAPDKCSENSVAHWWENYREPYCTLLCWLSQSSLFSYTFCAEFDQTGKEWNVVECSVECVLDPSEAEWLPELCRPCHPVGTKCHHAPSNLKYPTPYLITKCHHTPSNRKYPTPYLITKHPFKLCHYWCVLWHSAAFWGLNATMPHQKPLRHCSQSNHTLPKHYAFAAWLWHITINIHSLSLSSCTSSNTIWKHKRKLSTNY